MQFRALPRKLGIVTRIFPSPSNMGATGVVSLLSLEDVRDRLRKNEGFLFFVSTDSFFSGSTSVQVFPLWNRGIVRREGQILFDFATSIS